MTERAGSAQKLTEQKRLQILGHASNDWHRISRFVLARLLVVSQTPLIRFGRRCDSWIQIFREIIGDSWNSIHFSLAASRTSLR
jgi:hypothetical protein